MTWKPITIFMAVWALASPAFANNLDITNTTVCLVSRHSAGIQMDLSWENSWRDEFNHDAAWVFVKYSLDGGTNWLHATLQGVGTNPAGYSVGSNPNLDIIVPDDRKGAFIQPRLAGRTNITTTGLTLLWDLDADGIPAQTSGRVSAHGLEMVYIPTGPFYVGDDNSIKTFKVTYINTPDMTKATAESGTGVITNPYVNLTSGMGRPWGITGTFDPNYPNGYNAFYIMKYELSRARYLAFLNKLTTNQVATLRTVQYNFPGTSPSNYNWTVSYPINLTNAHPWRAAVLAVTTVGPSWAGYQEFFAYTDWAGLRPMTEIEYEKACRGPMLPVDRDYPWGTASRYLVNRVISANTAAESKFDADANLMGGSSPGSLTGGLLTAYWPLRCGALSEAASDQFQAGASYYGVMDMAGNAWERCIAVGQNASTGAAHTNALKYNGIHGDGQLNADGTSNVTNWPYPTANSYGGGPLGTRGGDYSVASVKCVVADRSSASQTGYISAGIRAVRTAP